MFTFQHCVSLFIVTLATVHTDRCITAANTTGQRVSLGIPDLCDFGSVVSCDVESRPGEALRIPGN